MRVAHRLCGPRLLADQATELHVSETPGGPDVDVYVAADPVTISLPSLRCPAVTVVEVAGLQRVPGLLGSFKGIHVPTGLEDEAGQLWQPRGVTGEWQRDDAFQAMPVEPAGGSTAQCDGYFRFADRGTNR